MPDAATSSPIPCCVCGETDARPWLSSRDNLLGGKTVFTAVRCCQCGTARLQPRPPAEAMAAYYSPATYARAEDGGELAQRLDLFFERQAERVSIALGKSSGDASPGRMLDVGCGDGRFLAAMRARGWQGVGLETDPIAAKLARERSGAEIQTSPLEKSTFPPESFDLVSLLHVLEHVPDPRTTLTAVFRALRPGGTLLLALPNACSVEAKVFAENWYQLDLPRHFWGFTPKALTRLVEECGFRAPRLRYLPGFFAPQSLRNVVKAIRHRPLSAAPEGGGIRREAGHKTAFFRALLTASERLGTVLPGEVMELTAVKPAQAAEQSR